MRKWQNTVNFMVQITSMIPINVKWSATKQTGCMHSNLLMKINTRKKLILQEEWMDILLKLI
jgi:hypothetical protein